MKTEGGCENKNNYTNVLTRIIIQNNNNNNKMLVTSLRCTITGKHRYTPTETQDRLSAALVAAVLYAGTPKKKQKKKPK